MLSLLIRSFSRLYMRFDRRRRIARTGKETTAIELDTNYPFF